MLCRLQPTGGSADGRRLDERAGRDVCFWLNQLENSADQRPFIQDIHTSHASTHDWLTSGHMCRPRRHLLTLDSTETRTECACAPEETPLIHHTRVLPEFRRFQDDTDAWLETANAPGSQNAWTDQEKWPVVTDHLRGAAKAWDRYKGMSQQSWSQSSSKFIAAFGHLQHAGCHHPTTYET